MKRKTIYDALEDRISNQNYGSLRLRRTRPSDQPRVRFAASPDRALAARLNVPIESIPVHDDDNNPLPKGDLLNAIHGFVSTYFHEKEALEGMNGLMKCMDASALLVLGMLVEEFVDELIGENGHFMLATENCEESDSSIADEVIQEFVMLDEHGNVEVPDSKVISVSRQEVVTGLKAPERSTNAAAAKTQGAQDSSLNSGKDVDRQDFDYSSDDYL